jgi:hypothetical protein
MLGTEQIREVTEEGTRDLKEQETACGRKICMNQNDYDRGR